MHGTEDKERIVSEWIWGPGTFNIASASIDSMMTKLHGQAIQYEITSYCDDHRLTVCARVGIGPERGQGIDVSLEDALVKAIYAYLKALKPEEREEKWEPYDGPIASLPGETYANFKFIKGVLHVLNRRAK